MEVRSKEEILRSLDKNGRLQELPFMPQMFQYCGKRFRVFKRAHKTCDTTASIWLKDVSPMQSIWSFVVTARRTEAAKLLV